MTINTFTWNVTTTAGWSTGADWNNLNGGGTGTAPNDVLNNTAIINQGGVSLDGNFSVNNLTVGTAGSLFLNTGGSNKLTVGSNVFLSNGATININSSSTLSTANFNQNGATSNFVLTGSAGATFTATATAIFNKGIANLNQGNFNGGGTLKVTGGDLQLNGATVAMGALTVSSGTLNLSSGTVSVTTATLSGGNVNLTGGSYTGTTTTVSGSNFNLAGATFNGTSTTVNGGNFNVSSGTFNGTGNLTVNGNGAVFNQSGGTITVGNAIFNANGISTGSSTINGTFTSNNQLNVGNSGNNSVTLSIGSTAAVTVKGLTTIHSTNNATSFDTINLQGGSLTVNGINFNGNVVAANMGRIIGFGSILNAGANAINNNANGNGTITASGNGSGGTTLTITPTINSGVILNIDSAHASVLNIAGTATAASAVGLTSGNQTLQVGNSSGNLTIGATETVAGGTLNVAAGALTDNAGISVSSGNFNVAGGTVTINGATGNLNVSGTGLFNQSGGTVTPNNVTVSGGNLNVSGGTLTIATNLAVSGGAFNEATGTTSLTVGNANFSGGSGNINAPFSATGIVTVNAATLTVSGSGNLKTTSGSATAINIGSTGNISTASGGTVNAASGTINIASGGVLFGAGTVNGALAGSGTVEASGGTLDLRNALTVSTLTYEVANVASSDLQLDSSVGSGETATFLGTGNSAVGELRLTSDTTFGGNISQLTVGNSASTPTSFIDINSPVTVTAGSFTGSGASGTIALSDSSTLQLTNIKAGDGTAASGTWFADYKSDGSGGTEIFLSTAPCYAAGTMILAERGEVAVEQLAVGERVISLVDGERVLKPVKWLGRRRLDLTAHPRPETVMPVRIAAGAFGDAMPHRDLVVSPDHAIFVDGLLIQARQLVNGTTIRQESDWTAVEYFHVELDAHGILLAEGLPAESYLNTGNHGFFQNSGEPLRLHPDLLDDENLPSREAGCCAPFVWDAARVEPVWRRLAERAAALGRPVALPETTTDPALRLAARGRQVKPVYGENGLYIFAVPRGADVVRILSRSAAPTETRPWTEDRRSLGVRIKRLVLRATGEVREIPVDHPALSEGWWDVERDGNAMRRWTRGEAVLPLPVPSGPAMLEVHISNEIDYVVPAEAAPAADSTRRTA